MKIEFPAQCAQILGSCLRPELFRALADPNRIALLCQLATNPEPTTVGGAASCCNVHLSVVSRHLAALRDAGIISAVKRGREVAYSINYQEISAALRALADALDGCCVANNCCQPAAKGTENVSTDSQPCA